ncbi:HNH endonuclease signature motif containing protein [Aquipuribacter sp. SD81]|uniref:HNH endonuclease signature motif containing protein n=1 Tax=Aquipuribacter sp. SD81 TaxID=3127703 RepID=UPI0030198ECF
MVGTEPDDDGPARGVLLSAVDRVAAATAALDRLASPGQAWRTRDADVLTAVAEVARVRAALDAVHLALVREVDQRGVAEASPVATSVEGFLRTACLVDRGAAARDVAAARATAPGAVLEPLGQALRGGRCTRAHVDVAVRCTEQLPSALLERPGAAATVSDYLLLAVTEATPREADRAAKALLRTMVDDPAERHDPRAHERRLLDLAEDATGMTVGRFQLDPVSGAVLRAALDRWSGPVSGADGERDSRSPRQRRADALVTALETASSVQGPQRGERPRIVVHVTPEQLRAARTPAAGDGPAGSGPPDPVGGRPTVEGGGQLPAWAARRLACDAVLQRLVASPTEGVLELGRTVRLASVTQRRALAGRDSGCVVHGCGAAPAFCDAHHVVHWADGGPTDLSNLVLLCPGHHTAVHAGTWGVDIDRTGQVWVVPPRWKDSRRTPRPAWRQRAERAREAVLRALRRPEDVCDAGPPGPVDRPGSVPPAPVDRPGASGPPGPVVLDGTSDCPGEPDSRGAGWDDALDAGICEREAWTLAPWDEGPGADRLRSDLAERSRRFGAELDRALATTSRAGP